MNDNLPASTSSAIGTIASAAGGALRYGILLTQLTIASQALRHVANQTRDTFNYVEECARNVDHLAETAATLNADTDTVAEHHDAAQQARAVRATALEMANHCQEMSTQFEQAKADHEADYGPVAEQANAMPVEMADRTFYANR